MTTHTRELQFASFDGITLSGTICSPAEPIKAIVLFVHGITSDRSEWGVFDKAAELFAEHGAASLRFDYRGHGKSTAPASQITLHGITRDIEAAWSQIAPTESMMKSYIIGSSFGGGLAYHTASVIGGFSHAFLLAPVFDYAKDIKKTAPKWKSDIKKKGYIEYSTLHLSADIVAEAEKFKSIPANANLSATIFHGNKDDDVPISSSRAVASRHRKFELIEVRGAGHVIAAPGDLDMEDPRSWAFVDQVLTQILTYMQLRG